MPRHNWFCIMDNFSVTGETKNRTCVSDLKLAIVASFLKKKKKEKERIFGSTRIICTLSEHL